MTNEYAGSKPPSLRDDALAVLQRLREAGHVAYFAGGCVRDMLLELEPKDFDVATDATPERVRSLFPNTQAVGAAFGVVLVRQRESVIEVATFRTDLEYRDGRHPTGVKFSTPEEDAARRDFTINGMFFDPVANQVIDYVGGQEDIRTKTLRAIGEPAKRFAEDHLRLLRAVRFAARFGLTIDPRTADAAASCAPKLASISPERITEELRQMLTPTTRGSAFRFLRELKLLPVIFRFVPKCAEIVEGDGNDALFARVAPKRSIGFHLALASALLSYEWSNSPDVSASLTPGAVARSNRALRYLLRLSNTESDALVDTLTGAGLLLNQTVDGVAPLKRFLARPQAANSRTLARALADCGVQCDRVATVEGTLSTLEKTKFAPAPLLTGDDLTAAGMKPGPAFKRILDQVYDAQLEGKIMSKDDAMELGKSLA